MKNKLAPILHANVAVKIDINVVSPYNSEF